MTKLRVAVLRGGPSHEYDLSMKTGAHILRSMPEHYEPHDIFISKEGAWHREGIERSPDRALAHIDVVVNALHGHYGADGKLQQLLDRLAIPYTGSGVVASSVATNKLLTKQGYQSHSIRTPYYMVVRRGDNLEEKTKQAFSSFLLPVIVKPAVGGSSIGVSLVKNFLDLEDALLSALQFSDTALVEEYVKGKEVTCGVIRNFRNEDVYVLLPVEVLHGKDFHTTEAKTSNSARLDSRTTLSEKEKIEVQKRARDVHTLLNLGQYSRSDMIVHPRRGIFVLETNTQPSLAPESSFIHSLESVGATLRTFIDHLISSVKR